MANQQFEDVQVWQKSKLLCKEIYTHFSKCKDSGFRDQIQRASVSVMNNIAEGYERHSIPEFKRFLLISKGSAGEVRSMLIIAAEIGYIDTLEAEKLIGLCVEVSKMLSGLHRSLQ